MGRVLAGAVILALNGGGLTLAAEPQANPPTIYEAAEARQAFYPVGWAYARDLRVDFYVLSDLSITKRPVLRAAVLMNVVKSPNGPYQIVEISSLVCATQTVKPTFRMIFDAKGHPLKSGGPVSADDHDDPGTLLTPEAARLTSNILCNGRVPGNALPDRTIADFRQRSP